MMESRLLGPVAIWAATLPLQPRAPPFVWARRRAISANANGPPEIHKYLLTLFYFMFLGSKLPKLPMGYQGGCLLCGWERWCVTARPCGNKRYSIMEHFTIPLSGRCVQLLLQGFHCALLSLCSSPFLLRRCVSPLVEKVFLELIIVHNSLLL